MKIRAHHLLCIPRYYRGIVYDRRYSENLRGICEYIRNNPDSMIKLTLKCDDICSKCPHMIADSCNKKPGINKRIINRDKQVLSMLNLEQKNAYKAKDIFNLSIEKIGEKEIAVICHTCQFIDHCLKWGVNNSFRKDINSS